VDILPPFSGYMTKPRKKLAEAGGELSLPPASAAFSVFSKFHHIVIYKTIPFILILYYNLLLC
jgi:hypothetical protein